MDGDWFVLGGAALLAAASLARRSLRGQPAEVGITFTDLTPEQLEHVFAAQAQLRKAGVSFDTGYAFGTRSRDWEWDWSLGGPVEVRYRRPTTRQSGGEE